MLYFENNLLDSIYDFFISIALNLNDYVIKLLWFLFIYIILRIIWFFFSRIRITIRHEIKTPFKR